MAVPDRTEPAGPGSPGSGPRAPGWYPDPDRTESLRYWDGLAWTSKERPRPAWGRDGSADGPAPADWPGDGHRDGPPAGAVEGPDPTSPRPSRRWMLFAGVAVLAAVAVGIAGEAMRPKSPGRRVLTDAGYVKLANAECARTLPDLRPPDSGPFGQAITPTQTAGQIDHAADGLDSLAGRLQALPASEVDRPHINSWLDDWHRYAGLGHQYATFLRQHGNASPGRLATDTIRLANTTDNFALANGLKDCTFFTTPQADPSNGF